MVKTSGKQKLGGNDCRVRSRDGGRRCQHQCGGGGGGAPPHRGRQTFSKRRLFGESGKENGRQRSVAACPPGPTVLDGQIVSKLDQSNPEHARRIHQRRKAIMYGKNTAGYEEYTKKVPKHRRKPRNIEYPVTPDHTVDIPNKRWQGLVKAWRRALHKYDPEDLQTRELAQRKDDKDVLALGSIFSNTNVEGAEAQTGQAPGQRMDNNVQERQIADAESRGMLVNFGGTVADAQSLASVVGGAASNLPEDEEDVYQDMIRQAEGDDADELVTFTKTDGVEEPSDAFLDDNDSDDDLL